MLHLSDIERSASEVGFDLCGVARVRPLKERQDALYGWLSASRHGSMGYMERNSELRLDPSLLVEGAQSVICCAVSYNSVPSFPVASFAMAPDYHVTIKQMLTQLASVLGLSERSVAWRAFVDSAPILEKAWAVEAGLGAIGRNSLLINPIWGSKILLGELVVALPTDHYCQPMEWDSCGGCSGCVDSCPNGAIGADRMIDARLCIARLTIEKRDHDAPPEMLHGWIWGCDECQECCPHNLGARKLTNRDFEPTEKISSFAMRKNR